MINIHGWILNLNWSGKPKGKDLTLSQLFKTKFNVSNLEHRYFFRLVYYLKHVSSYQGKIMWKWPEEKQNLLPVMEGSSYQG